MKYLSQPALVCSAFILSAGCGSPQSSAPRVVTLEPDRIPHQQSDERIYRDVEILWSDTLDLDIGEAVSIRLLPDTTILVGDGGYETISRYDRSGALLQRFGAPGPGPGEFEDLRSVIPLSEGRVVGIDAHRRANVFGADGLRRSRSLGSGSSVAAPFADGFITINPLSSPMFRAFNDTLGATVSFGEPLYPLEQGLFGVGGIVDGSSTAGSSAAGPTVILVAMYSGIMVAYDGEGAPKWSIRTVDPPRLSELRMNGMALDGESVSQSAISLNGDGTYFYVIIFVQAAVELDLSVDVYDVADGAYLYTMRHPSTECAYRDIRGNLGVQTCADQRLIVQKFSID